MRRILLLTWVALPIGGLAYLKAIAAPYTGVSFIPTGGVGPTNLASYLAFPRVVACGGSWMASSEWIAAKQFDRIRETSAAAMTIVGAATEARRS